MPSSAASAQHVCPYAAALSDDEDASYVDHVDQPAGHPSASAALSSLSCGAALSAARERCPAFANRSCPFRDAGGGGERLREVMRTVPPSHYLAPPAVSEGGGGESSNKEGGRERSDSDAAAQFRLAMQHIHAIQKQISGSSNGEGGRESDAKRDSFLLKGGCPFKSFHSGRETGGKENAGTNLAEAMESFSLAAIMGRLAEESLGEKRSEDGEGTADAPSLAPSLSDEEAEETAGATPNDDKSDATARPPPQLSAALKTGTAESHEAAENVHFVRNFIRGEIDRELYKELVAGLYHTYAALERLLDLHAPGHFGTCHFPLELGRLESLREDMEYWHGDDWDRPGSACSVPSPAVRDYVDRLEEVAAMEPLLLLSHAYTRYLGDLSGGKVLSRIARRALRLDGHDGLAFYDFERVPSAKAFKDAYRGSMDGLDLTEREVGRVVAEANVAFALNMRVFEELDVRGGVDGARVRDVGEALAYYDREVEAQRAGGGRGRPDGEEEGEEKCPFGFVGGANPHASASGAAPSPAGPGTKERGGAAEGGGRCPWPFVFLHDPARGMRDWQTWLVVGLAMSWLWSKV